MGSVAQRRIWIALRAEPELFFVAVCVGEDDRFTLNGQHPELGRVCPMPSSRPITSAMWPTTSSGTSSIRPGARASLPAPAGEVPELIPYDAKARKALELTFREALRLGHNHIGTEHILLALLELEGGAGVLTELGIDKAKAEEHIGDAVAAAVDQG